MDKKTICFGRVNEVKIIKDRVLLPLTPLDNRGTHFMATIIYDLVQLGYNKKDIEFYYKYFLKNNSISSIIEYIKDHNRMIWKDVADRFNNEVLIKEVFKK